MALYRYQAFSKDGRRLKGQLDASSIQSVREQIAKMGMYPVTIELADSGKPQAGFMASIFQPRVPLKSLLMFTSQLSVLLKSSVPLLQALELLQDQFDGQFRQIIINLKDGIKEGQSLAAGLAQYPSVFDNIYVQLVRAGEATGKLETILDRLTGFLERRAQVRTKVTSALRAPLIQLVMAFVVVLVMATFVVPQITQVIQKMSGTLPLSTRILIGFSDLILGHYIALLVGVGLAVISLILISRTEKGSLALDKLKLNIPIMSYFTRTSAIVQFCSTLGMLLESGVNLSEALDIVCSIVDNKVLSTTLQGARDKIVKEGKIAQYLKQTGIFPSLAIYLINTGEQSGRLDSMLLTVGRNYEQELIERSDSLSDQLDPIMKLVVGGIVGFIVFSIMSAIMGATNFGGKLG